ncbi:MAG: acetyltransferase, partial [Candidatus Muiribacteriota bacterium]
GGGHCKSCIDVVESTKKYDIVGVLDKKENVGKEILGYKIIGTDEMISELAQKDFSFLITLGQIKNVNVRKNIYKEAKKYNCELPVIIASTAYVSKYSEIDEGTIVMHNAFVNANTKIGKNCIINTKAIIEHDAEIGDFCHISTGVIVNGDVKIGNENFIGSNSAINQSVKIGNNNIIGASSLFNKDITDNNVMVGIPAKRIKENK